MRFRKPLKLSNCWKAKKEGYVITIILSPIDIKCKTPYYYFLIKNEDTKFRYNSLWDSDGVKTFKECCEQAEKYLDEVVLAKEQNKEKGDK